MNKNKLTRISGVSDRITSTISVALVLFILGLVATINITFTGLERSVKEKIGFSVVLADTVTPAQISEIRRFCGSERYVKSYEYLSADDVLREETQGEGAALVEQLGFNPYAPMIDIKVTADRKSVV